MDEHAEAGIVLFGGFRFDRRRGLLSRHNEDGRLVLVAIGARALDVLGLLIDRQGDLVSRDEILNAVWPGVVEGANVTVQISALRRALDDGRSDGSLIQTIPGRSYRLAAAVTRCEADPLPEVGGNGADRGENIEPVSPVPTGAPTRQDVGTESPPYWLCSPWPDRLSDARELLAPISGWFTKGFDTPDLRLNLYQVYDILSNRKARL
jgi:DNA-binding winged helix-turn-helix (wHTH) protein